MAKYELNSAEERYQPGSGDLVLANKLGIIDEEEMDALESLARPELVSYLAECHVEFILIHPFREGNGRLSRLLCDVLSVLAGEGLLDYSLWDEHKAFYFKAIQAGVSGNYSPMMQLVSDILPD